MHYEPMRMQRWLSIHSITPYKLRKQDEKFIVVKHPVLNIKVNGNTIDQNFSDLREYQRQLAIKHQLDEVKRDTMAIGGAGNYFTTESENNPYEESDSSVDRTHRRNISLKGDPQYGQSSSNRSRKSSHRVQHSSQYPKSGGLKHSQSTETLKSNKIGEYGNNGQLSVRFGKNQNIDPDHNNQHLNNRRKSYHKKSSRQLFSQDFATMSQHQNKKNTDSLVRSSIIPENNVQNSSKANQNYLSPQQSIVFSGRKSILIVQQSMESIQEYQTAASNMSIKELKEMRRKSKKILSEQQKEKAILHKHTIKVLRPATAQVHRIKIIRTIDNSNQASQKSLYKNNYCKN